jgi:hypothetical protein
MYNKIAKIDSSLTPAPARAYAGPATVGIEYDVAAGGGLIIAIDELNPPTRVTLFGATSANGVAKKSDTLTTSDFSATARFQNQFSLVLTPAATVTNLGQTVTPLQGDLTLSAGKTISDGFFIGINGKFIATTGVAIGASALRIAGVYGKTDLGTLAFTSGQASGIWADLAGSPTGSLVEVSVLRVSNSMGVGAYSLINLQGSSTYLFNYDNVSASVFLAAGSGGTSSAGYAGGAGIPAKVLKVEVSGVVYYVPLYSSNA